jgi:hypothetical protein
VEADPGKSYTLAERNGPWMISACAFSGAEAEQQAADLVLELRSRYKLEAYVHKMKFDFHDAKARGVDRFGTPRKARYNRGEQLQEIGVLVGNFQTVDDPEAQTTLQRIKYAQPKCLELSDDKKSNQSLAGFRAAQQQVQAAFYPDRKKKGPMDHAFVTTNPLLPKDYFVPNGVDDLVVKMNKEVPHSLLDCPGKYTVQVAHFTGAAVVGQAKVREILEQDKPVSDGLAKAALRAHLLTEALRMLKYEAYEFHDRFSSIVTVGSFDSLGTEHTDGTVELNPKVQLTIKAFAPDCLTQPGQVKPKKMGPFLEVGEIPFDIQPLPIPVPKRSIAAAYNRNTLDLR